MSKIIVVIAKKKSSWVPKATRAISDEDSPTGKKQKQKQVAT